MEIPQLWVSAAQLGCFSALLALAYYLVLTGAGFFNFAIGAYAMVGGLCAAWLVEDHGISVWPAFSITVAATITLAAATELVIVRPVQRRSYGNELPALIAVAAVLFTIQQAAGYIFGYTTLPGQRLVNSAPVTIGSTFLEPDTIILYGLTIVIFVGTAIWIRSSNSGRLLRAVGDSRDAATTLGFPVGQTRLVAFCLSGMLAAVSGFLFAENAGVNSLSGLDWALSGFLALVIGGSGSVVGPLAGGLILGTLQVFIPYYLGGAALSYTLLLLALVFFAFRPQGLFARRVRI